MKAGDYLKFSENFTEDEYRLWLILVSAEIKAANLQSQADQEFYKQFQDAKEQIWLKIDSAI